VHDPGTTVTGPGGGFQNIVASIVDGIRFLWQHPGLIPPLLAVWGLLAWPWYVLSRRRALTAVMGGRR
jgi:hypothetical protein